MRTNWAFWVLVVGVTCQLIRVLSYAAGLKVEHSLNASPAERVSGVIVNLLLLIIFLVALGWL